MDKKIIITINGLGYVEFFEIDENKVFKFVTEKADGGYLVAEINEDHYNNIKDLVSDKFIEFKIQKGE